jgi:hypothetical protein
LTGPESTAGATGKEALEPVSPSADSFFLHRARDTDRGIQRGLSLRCTFNQAVNWAENQAFGQVGSIAFAIPYTFPPASKKVLPEAEFNRELFSIFGRVFLNATNARLSCHMMGPLPQNPVKVP